MQPYDVKSGNVQNAQNIHFLHEQGLKMKNEYIKIEEKLIVLVVSSLQAEHFPLLRQYHCTNIITTIIVNSSKCKLSKYSVYPHMCTPTSVIMHKS